MRFQSTSLLLILLIGLCASLAAGEKPAPARDQTLSDAELKLSTELLQLTHHSLLPAGMTRQQLTRQLQDQRAYQPSGQEVRGVNARAPSEVVYVYVTLSEGTPVSIVDPHAWRVRNRDVSGQIVAAWVEVSRLRSLASIPGVTGIRTVLLPVTNTGSVTAGSDRIHLADQLRAQYGLTGAGIRIGVLSDGVDHWSNAAASGDLPVDLHVLRNHQGGDEGTAMLEIIHDIAPGAELYFHDCGENSIDFSNAVDALVAAGCVVIVDDISWITEPFFQDGSVAIRIQDLTSTANVLYLSSAGNSAQSHYQGPYWNDGYDYHDFSGGTATWDKSLYVRVPPGGSLRAVLEWDDAWTDSSNDYDFYLYDTSSWEVLAFSQNIQNGGDEPLEFLWYENTANATIEAEIDVYKYDKAAEARTLEVYVYPADGTQIFSNNIVAADSVYGHAAAPNTVAVGAINADDPGADAIAEYSSLGPATIRYPGSAERLKPDLTGIDGVAISGSGGFPNPFYGTSASAPAVAAVSALVWSGAPTKTALQVRQALLASSVDLGANGPDTTFGNGRVDAISFSQHLGMDPALTSITPGTGARNTTVGIADLAGARFQPGATVALTRTGQADIPATNVVVESPTRITCRLALPSAAATGPWNVSVTNPNSRNATLIGAFTITLPVPTAAFTAEPTSGTAPLTVTFTDASVGDGITDRRWEFGDGGVSNEQHPAHTYAAAGHYTVNLTVTNAAGTDSEVKNDLITVEPETPPVGETGFFLISTHPSGAEIYLDDSSTRSWVGNTTAGPLNVTVNLTTAPMSRIIANRTGYRDAIWNITEYPARGETVPVNLTLEPISTPTPGVRIVPGGVDVPTPTATPTMYDDVNGNGRKDFSDVVLYFNQMSWIAANEPMECFDYNGNARIDFSDVVWLFNHL